MRQESRISLGPGAASLILIVVILSMSVLGILSLMNARSDYKLSERNTQVAEAVYALHAKAEETLAELDTKVGACAAAAEDEDAFLAVLAAALPQGMQLEGREISWTETDGLRTLECRAEITQKGDIYGLRWMTYKMTAVTEDTDLWN